MPSNIDYQEWEVIENKFDINSLGKCEAIMCLGNGYMCVRSSTEEHYYGEIRNLFVAGTYNTFDDSEVSELPNASDLIGMEIYINNERFTLETGSIKSYERAINLKTGELCRKISWISPSGVNVGLDFYRFVSMSDKHLLAQKIVINAIDRDLNIKIQTGIDGIVSNSGSQHFSEGEKRYVHGNQIMQYITTTTKSKIPFVLSCGCKINNSEFSISSNMSRRRVLNNYEFKVKKGNEQVFEKFSNVYTKRDKELENFEIEKIQDMALEKIKEYCFDEYNKLLEKSVVAWEELIWNKSQIIIDTEHRKDQLLISFAQYHLAIMAPVHDERMNIAAKGLSGEGYKGHVYWDTEIFILPYFIYTQPEFAKKLEIYRYLTLDPSRENAKRNGFNGAQYPWESAWINDGDATPDFGDLDIVTGKPQIIWPGKIEYHVTADVAFGVWTYFHATNDFEFLNKYGYEIIFETANFWASRLEYNEVDGKYHMYDVIGPDEYKEHVDDNAYTNYMCSWNLEKAIEFYNELMTKNDEIFQNLNKKLELDKNYKIWCNKISKIYLPTAGKDLVIPQDAKYLSLKKIDLKKYKEQKQVRSIYKDFNANQLDKIQVSKQGDVLLLLYLMGDKFSKEIIKANWNYYEPLTLHDSSLSLSTHCIIANILDERQKAYEFFEMLFDIDLGTNMKTSDSGIHAASLGGVWLSIVFGFAGLKINGDSLEFSPKLPEKWNGVKFNIQFQGKRFEVIIERDENGHEKVNVKLNTI